MTENKNKVIQRANFLCDKMKFNAFMCNDDTKHYDSVLSAMSFLSVSPNRAPSEGVVWHLLPKHDQQVNLITP